MTIRHVVSNAAMRGGKKPLPHRFHLSDGRVIEGKYYREPDSRLTDDLYGTKGSFLSVLDARCVSTGTEIAFLAINLDHIVSIEELPFFDD